MLQWGRDGTWCKGCKWRVVAMSKNNILNFQMLNSRGLRIVKDTLAMHFLFCRREGGRGIQEVPKSSQNRPGGQPSRDKNVCCCGVLADVLKRIRRDILGHFRSQSDTGQFQAEHQLLLWPHGSTSSPPAPGPGHSWTGKHEAASPRLPLVVGRLEGLPSSRPEWPWTKATKVELFSWLD